MASGQVIDGNFAFVYNSDPEFYLKARLAEQKARTDYGTSGQNIRQAMEMLVNRIIARSESLKGYCVRTLHGMQALKDVRDLKNRLDVLRSREALLAAGYIESKAAYDRKRPLPNLQDVEFRRVGSKKVERENAYEFIRELGNTCSHGNDLGSKDIYLDYETIVKAIKVLHDIAAWHWRNQRGANVPFREDIMPIEEYHITSACIPQDTRQSHCLMEFNGYLADDSGRPWIYAILRMYARPKVQERNFILRNLSSYQVANAERPTDIPGMVRPMEVTRIDDATKGCYILAYQFKKEPRVLAEILPTIKDPVTRFGIGRNIIQCMNELHRAEVPISHRMLNCDGIYICEYKKGIYTPHIIKFDYARIAQSERPVVTVFMNAQEARNSVQRQQRLNKYIAPEWDHLDQNSNDTDWSRVDVYSLGILMIEILLGRVLDAMPGQEELFELEDLGYSADIVDTLDLMCAGDPLQRPDLQWVCEVLDAVR